MSSDETAEAALKADREETVQWLIDLGVTRSGAELAYNHTMFLAERFWRDRIAAEIAADRRRGGNDAIAPGLNRAEKIARGSR